MTKQLLRLALFSLICLSIPKMATAQAVFIPDFNLRAVIEEHLGIAPGGTITVADMAWLTEIDATNQNIRNLTGLETATNLIWLWLGENSISDISPLAGLTKLTQLELADNFISDISPLARLTRLIYLNLLTNSISNISIVARLTDLTILDLGGNRISNISALAGLTNLEELWIDHNSISDLWPLVANTGLRNGDTVDVSGNPLSALSINTHIPTLQNRGVTVEFDQIVVQTVNIPDPNLRNIIAQALGKAPSAIITVADMAWLTGLDATNQNITNLTGLEHATNLTRLWLRNNSISNIFPLAGLTKLTLLDLRDNFISNISPLARLTNLTVLGLARNKITNISSLAGLTNLTELGLGQNNITNISSLAGLTKLNILWLPDNFISDLWPLVANTGLRNGDEVNVQGNPLSTLSINTHIPTLQSRGVTVEFDQIFVPPPPPPQSVNIPDPNLRNAVEKILRKAPGATITIADMATLDALYAIKENIRNLTGLEHAINLTELGLGDNFISDISPLAGLTRLRLLDLRDNLISNISPLARLTNLTELGLGKNSISNLSPLAGLTKLTALNLWNNSIFDISPLARLTKLTELYLQDNSISDLWPLVANTGLGRGDILDISRNPLNLLSLNTHIPTLLNRGVTVTFDQIVVPTVNIPDPNLRNVIAQTLGKAPGAIITGADMARLTELDAPNRNITNLAGLETATNLTKLYLRFNSISDLSPLTGLTRLTVLILRDNSISDISPLTRLTNLTGLGLGNNNITYISPLAGLTNLRELGLGNNNISDISPLARLTNLRELGLRNNNISDLWPLVANTGLGNGDTVDVTGNPLSTVSFTTHLATLRSRGVTMEFDQIVVPPPPPPPQLVNIPDPNIRHAIRKALGEARDATITIEHMARLTELEVIRKSVTNLTGLEHATNLTRLVLRNNAIADLSPLAGLTQLTFLHLASNQISNISLLARFTQLTFLHLGENTISNISALSGLTNLTALGLGRNNITDISPLARLTNLTELGLHNNSISNISPLERLTNLTELYLDNNSISDLSPLVENIGLRSGDTLNVRGNPLNDLSFNTYIPTLQNRGVNVESDQIIVTPKTVDIPDPNLRNAIEQVLHKAQGAIITIADMQTLAALYTTSKNIRNLTGLEHATNLRELGLVDNQITDISPLAGLTNLRTLWLDDNSISDISPLAGLTNLTDLRLLNNAITDISPLVGNTGLGNGDWIDLRGNVLNDASIITHIPTLQNRGIVVEFDEPLVPPETVDIPSPNLRKAIIQALGKAPGASIIPADMETLEVLHATNTNIINLTGLETATNLTELGLLDNNISDISPLVGLTNLTTLDLRDNRISDISSLARLTNLKTLRLARNDITNISVLAGLMNLATLDLRNNSISDILPLVQNAGIGNGDWIDLRENPLNNASINTHILTLQSRGVTVELDQTVVPPTTVNIPDSNLRSAIEKALGKAPGAPIAVADMGVLDSFHASNEKITNLTGLETATNLVYLYLENNSISDLLPLAGLTKLLFLDLRGNVISNLSPLAGLTRLEHLYLENNSISDLLPLSRLTNLKTLRLAQNSISDISLLVTNTGLGGGDWIGVRENPLNNISINTHIPTLQSRGVAVEFDNIVAPPTTVDIPDPNLRNAIEKALGKASGATITMPDMETLTALYATNNNIINLTGLETATNLTELGLRDNSILDISPLAGLTNLTLLDLRDNSISNISPLARLTNLTTLQLARNNITNISPLAGLTNLKQLALRTNSISDLSPLVQNTGLGNGESVNVRENPLSALSINTHIPTLQSRGVIVTFDEIVVPPKTVNIPDTNLRNAIEKVLGKAPGATITVGDMETLTTLNAANKNIINLTGLETAANLTELDLQNNFISNLSYLSKLTKLQRLYLQDNSISDLSYLAGNIGLGSGDKVNLKGNPISTISINTYIPTLQSRGVTVEFDAPPKTVNIPDTNLRNVIETTLRKAPGATITPADMERLTNLNGTNENITNLTGIEYATNLVNLVLINTNITDLSPLARLAKLHYLDLANNSISDISPLAKLTRLGYLNLVDNSISDISLVAELPQLTYLNLDNNSISDISPIVANTRLGNGHEVYIRGNPLSDISFNTHIPTLQSRGVIVTFDEIVVPPKTVNIPDTNLRSAIEKALRKAPGTAITVADMETLNALYALNENITNLTGLEAAINLTVLDLRDNPISDISLLAGLTNLTLLRLDSNSISDISPFAELTKLTELYLQNNSISDLSPLVQNTGLGNGDEVNVKGNPLSPLSFNTYIPTLQSRGVTIEFDDIVAKPEDVNGDGSVNILDLGSVAAEFGNEGQNLAADVNGDGVVNIVDLVLVVGRLEGEAAAPSAQPQATFTAAEVQGWLTDAKSLEIKDTTMKRGIMVLEQLWLSLAPTETKLLPNYPNPFNPETWIPYRLADDAFVTLTIYDQTGQVVRTIDVGHQTAAFYENRSQAIYWDGRNETGE